MNIFDDPYETIKEGPVEIRFEESEGKIKITYTVDFGKTDFSPSKAATIMKAIVAVLRTSLDVELSKCT